MIYYRWFPGDYLRDTTHLTCLEDCAYRRLLDLYYSQGKALTTDREMLYRQVRMTGKAEKRAVDAVLDQYFFKRGKNLHNSKANAELLQSKCFLARQVKAGKARGLQQKQKAATAEPKTSLQSNPLPIQENQSRNTVFSQVTRSASPPANGNNSELSSFEEFWMIYPIHEAKVKARQQWIELHLAPMAADITASLLLWKSCEQWQTAQYIPLAWRFLADARWKETPRDKTKPAKKSLEQQLKELMHEPPRS